MSDTAWSGKRRSRRVAAPPIIPHTTEYFAPKLTIKYGLLHAVETPERHLRMTFPKSILVVDDDANLRQTLVMIIRNAGYEVFVAESAQRCLLLLQSRTYDLMVLDQKIHGMNGLTLITVIRRMYPEMPVLFLAGNGSSEMERTLRQSGIRGYLVKPIDPEKILDLVQTLCPKTPAQ
jgi:two-component system chemotaxis response regulator CheY